MSIVIKKAKTYWEGSCTSCNDSASKYVTVVEVGNFNGLKFRLCDDCKQKLISRLGKVSMEKKLLKALKEVNKIQKEICELLDYHGELRSNSRISNVLSHLVPETIELAEKET